MTTSPSNPKIIYLTDRTTIETDWECGMKRWWYKEEGGTGIVPAVERPYFSEGREIHDDLHKLALAPDPTVQAIEILEALNEKKEAAAGDQLVLESLSRRMGWVASWALYNEPLLRATYENVALEHELVLDREPLWVAVTPDRAVRQKEAPKRLVLLDYKGVGGWGATLNWMEYWPYAIQQHTILKALGEEMGEEALCGQIVGLYKGQQRDGRLYHPYVWAFFNPDTGEWFPLGSGKRGLTYRPVWEYDGGMLEWVQKCGPDIARDMFPVSRPIFLNERLLEDLVIARTRREQEVSIIRAKAQADRTVRAQHFEPRFSKCRPVIGDACPYQAACHNASVNADPLGSGLYVPRVPHHDLETIMKGESYDDTE